MILMIASSLAIALGELAVLAYLAAVVRGAREGDQ